MTNIYLISYILVFLYIWFETDAFIEWGRLLKLSFLNYQEFFQIRTTQLAKIAARTYPDFLIYKYHHLFLIKLVTCPVCFSVWLNIIGTLIFSYNMFWQLLPINILVVWVFYPIMKKLINE